MLGKYSFSKGKSSMNIICKKWISMDHDDPLCIMYVYMYIHVYAIGTTSYMGYGCPLNGSINPCKNGLNIPCSKIRWLSHQNPKNLPWIQQLWPDCGDTVGVGCLCSTRCRIRESSGGAWRRLSPPLWGLWVVPNDTTVTLWRSGSCWFLDKRVSLCGS